MKALNRIQKDMRESPGSTTLSSSLLECAEEISTLFGESSEGKLNLPESLDSIRQTSILHLESEQIVTPRGVCPHVWVEDLSITGEA